MTNKCKCGKYIPEFSPSIIYCSKNCEDKYKGYGVNDLLNIFGMTK